MFSKRILPGCVLALAITGLYVACAHADAGITDEEMARADAKNAAAADVAVQAASSETTATTGSDAGASMAGSSMGVSSRVYANQGMTPNAGDLKNEKARRQIEEMQKEFTWWPTDAKPGPVKDSDRGGYWWWPEAPGKVFPWGNRGYCYVYKLIFDYKEEELPAPKPKEMRPSLLIKKIVKNVKIYFDYNKAELRDDGLRVLNNAVESLKRNPQTSILITGNCDIRGTENYNEKLGNKRGASVKKYMLDNGIPEERIKIVSRGKLNAVAPLTDLVGMQKDRNAQFMIAEVEEVMIPYPDCPEVGEAKQIEEGKYVVEEQKKLEGDVKVKTKEYIVQKGDNLWKIAEKQLGSGYRWKYLYEINKDRIKNKEKLRVGSKLIIPIE
ncbi:MAG: OmpA family protein [Candidatus Omnitrophota bacterium]